MNEDLVLCGASGKQQLFYLNPRYQQLPLSVQDELKASLSLVVERVGGTILLVFTEGGALLLKMIPDEDDIYYDEIEAGLALSRLQREKEDLFRQLEVFYAAFFGGKPCI